MIRGKLRQGQQALCSGLLCLLLQLDGFLQLLQLLQFMWSMERLYKLLLLLLLWMAQLVMLELMLCGDAIRVQLWVMLMLLLLQLKQLRHMRLLGLLLNCSLLVLVRVVVQLLQSQMVLMLTRV